MMRLAHDYLPEIVIHRDPTVDTLQGNVCQLDLAVRYCNDNIKEIARWIEPLIECKLEEQIHKIYKVLCDTKKIDIEEDEFMNLLKG